MTKPSRSASKGRLAPGRVVAGGERLHRVEARDPQHAHRRLGASRERHVEVAALQAAQRLAHRVRAGAAGARGAPAGALEAVAHGDVARGHVGDHLQDEEGAHPIRTLLQRLLVRLLEARDAADARAEDARHPRRQRGGDRELRVRHRQVARRDGQLREAVHAPQLALLDEVLGHEVAHLAGDARVQAARVEEGDGPHAAAALHERAPGLLHSGATRADGGPARSPRRAASPSV